MKTLSKTMLALLVTGIVSGALFSPHAQADQITGQISFAGVVRLNSPSLLTATRVNQWRDIFNHNPGFSNVSGASTGDFSGISPGALAHFATPWTFGLVSGGPQTAFWSVGGFTFDLISSTVDMRTAVDLVIHGTGTITGNGFDATPGTWDFHITNAGGQNHQSFSFTASTSGVPDGGSAVALLGIALAGIEVVRRKIKVKAA